MVEALLMLLKKKKKKNHAVLHSIWSEWETVFWALRIMLLTNDVMSLQPLLQSASQCWFDIIRCKLHRIFDLCVHFLLNNFVCTIAVLVCALPRPQASYGPLGDAGMDEECTYQKKKKIVCFYVIYVVWPYFCLSHMPCCAQAFCERLHLFGFKSCIIVFILVSE